MTTTNAKTTIKEIRIKLDELEMQRSRVASIDKVLRWIVERDCPTLVGNRIKPAITFRRDTANQSDGYAEIKLNDDAYRVALLIARDHWAGMIPPLEAWLDSRGIEHQEAATPG